jgi:hypothetical protein
MMSVHPEGDFEGGRKTTSSHSVLLVDPWFWHHSIDLRLCVHLNLATTRA